jgi:hypothetical protein
MSVSIGPGYTPETSTLVSFNSARKPCITLCTAAFETEYVTIIGIFAKPAIDEILTIAAESKSFMVGKNAFVTFTTHQRFTSRFALSVSSSFPPRKLPIGITPALFTKISTSVAIAAARVIDLSFVTSSSMGINRFPYFSTSSLRDALSLTPAYTFFAPFSKSSIVIAFPIPRLAQLTNATFPSTEKPLFFIL